MAVTSIPRAMVYHTDLDPEFETEDPIEATAHDAAIARLAWIEAYVRHSGRYTTESNVQGEVRRLQEFAKQWVILDEQERAEPDLDAMAERVGDVSSFTHRRAVKDRGNPVERAIAAMAPPEPPAAA